MVGVVVVALVDDERLRMVERERSVRLVRLHDQRTLPDAGDGERAGFAADAPADVLAQREKEFCDPGCRRCLAVGAADGDRVRRGSDELRQDFAAHADRPAE